MKRYVYICFTLFVLCLPMRVFAIDEIFRVETQGTEWCGDFDSTKFNSRNNTDIWVFLPSDIAGIVVSFTSTFDDGTWFVMLGEAVLTTNKTASFYATAFEDEFTFVTIQGTAKADKFGGVASLTGTFISSNVFGDGCFSKGTFKTVQRLQ